MKASYRWLRSLVPGLVATPEEVADKLTHAGIEVEGLTSFGAGLEPVVVAAVRKIEPHPSRSSLQLVTVDRGEGQEQRVVCGASNVPEPGGLVVLAPMGTHLPAKNLTLTAREIGGIVSEGMLCSEEELGLAEPGEDAGILVLPPGTATPGTPFLEAIPGAQDTIFDLSLTPNRPDCLGHIGLARELAALYDLPWSPPKSEAPLRKAAGDINDIVKVTILDYERCPQYGAAALVDVKIGPSPAWLRYRLSSLGIRPISNVVDITNLILLEHGHPMHAFDLDHVRGAEIIVRRARSGERITTLDGVDRALDADDLVICDAEGPVALAGVMGGKLSEISEKTTRVLLECAYFSPRGIRRSSRRHGLHSDSSHRFERGVDSGRVGEVLAHAIRLISELADGAAVPGTIHAMERAPEAPTVRLRSSRLDALLGVPVPFDEAKSILARLGFTITKADAKELEVLVPTHRPDVSREADLIEEVARVRGLDKIPTVLPAILPQPPREEHLLEARVRKAAVELGLSEALPYSFLSPRELKAIAAEPAVIRLQNPLTEERSVMRTSLVPGLLEAASRAHRRGEDGAKLFALGARFLGPIQENGLPTELPSFAAILGGEAQAYLGKSRDFDVWDAKGLAVELVERVTRQRATIRAFSEERRPKHLHPRGAAEVFVGEASVGQFGPLHPDAAEALDIEIEPIQIVEFDLRALGKLGERVPQFSPIPRLPAITRDLALVVEEKVQAGEVLRTIEEAAGELCESVSIFDLFRGGSLQKGQKSLAFRVIYRDPKARTKPSEARTLTDKEVDKRHQAVIEAARKAFGAELRG